jgi:hypothetical protein
MQVDVSSLDEKTKAVLAQYGAKWILGDLADIPPEEDPESEARVLQFLAQYVPLRPYVELTPSQKEDVEFGDVIYCAKFLRQAWAAKTKEEITKVNESLEWIFSPTNYRERPALRVDFDTGRYEPRPRWLMDVLAIELIRSRGMLHRCERPECQRHFVRTPDRRRYCSEGCSREMRSRKLSQYRQDNRDELNRRRRKKPTAKKRRKAQ